ncbi:glycoside hydrolase family 16 protein [Multifurca ochricompacta]|uniref:Glycoside hydrolase family 16 protein n=1 Tax=Multifurca ochricompacta TaxID=376703 RepID=A0AAD4M186_9AGAM|nr:glycoside hydrolase family 16 protein [Multifurca ochricompacta]
MRTGYAFLVTLSLSLIQSASALFFLKDQWIGDDFFQGWNWETENDPTHGRVNYVSQAEAISKNLTYVEDDVFFMRADDWSFLNSSSRGRDSIRISSVNAYDDALFVLDLRHMPQGCSTWPAFWTLSQAGPWPNGGEIDIIEGVNLNTDNQATLHTTPMCMMPPDTLRHQAGRTITTNCDTSVNFNTGCGVSFPDSKPSYGMPFNIAGGGIFAALKWRFGIQVWFWPRDEAPPEVRDGVVKEEPLFPGFGWGSPAADFPVYPGFCDYDTHFNAHEMVFDLTFCGDWAGNAWAGSGCGGGTCENFVDNNPSAFAEAYWAINSLRVYTPLFPFP